MEIAEQSHGAVKVLRPAGALTAADAAQFLARASQVAQASLGRLVVDASAVAYADSQGLEALLDLTERLQRGGRVLKLCAAGQTLREALELTGLAELFEQYEDVNSAVRSFL